MTLYKMFKQNAKLALKGNWGKAVLVLLFLIGITLILTGVQQYALDLFIGIPAASNPTMERAPYYASEAEIIILSVFSLLTILLICPLEMGLIMWFFSVVRGRKVTVADAFVFFESGRKYFKSIVLYLNIFIRGLLWAILFYSVPSAILGLSTQIVNGRLSIINDNPRLSATFGTMGIALSLILLALATVLYAVFMNRYSLAFYLFFDDMDISTRMAIKSSVKYSKGYRMNLFLFSLSFIGWALLCVLVIPVFYVLPYYYTSHAMYCRYIIEKNAIAAPEPTREFTVLGAEQLETAYEEYDYSITDAEDEDSCFPEMEDERNDFDSHTENNTDSGYNQL